MPQSVVLLFISDTSGRVAALLCRAFFLTSILSVLASCGLVSAYAVSRSNSATSAKPPQSTSGAETAATPGPSEPTLETVLEPRPGDGPSSLLHEQHSGHIVFAKAKIPLDAPSADQLATDFTAYDFVYGRAYFPHSLENHPIYNARGEPRYNTEPSLDFRLFVDGTPFVASAERTSLPNEKRTISTYQILLHPDPADGLTNETWRDLIAGLSKGRHTIRVEAWTSQDSLQARTPIAAGEFTLEKRGNEKLGIGRTFEDLKEGLSDKQVLAQIKVRVEAVKKHDKNLTTFSDIKIADANWSIVTNIYTKIPDFRQIQVWAKQKKKDGSCFAQILTFGQSLVKGKPIGSIGFYGYGAASVEIDCERVERAEPVPPPLAMAAAAEEDPVSLPVATVPSPAAPVEEQPRPEPPKTAQAQPAPQNISAATPTPMPTPMPTPTPTPMPTPMPTPTPTMTAWS